MSAPYDNVGHRYRPRVVTLSDGTPMVGTYVSAPNGAHRPGLSATFEIEQAEAYAIALLAAVADARAVASVEDGEVIDLDALRLQHHENHGLLDVSGPPGPRRQE